MGIFGKIRQKIIVSFLSNRTNLTLLQCMIYLIIGYVMGQYLDWIRMIIMFILLLGIQWITRIKAVADGMVFRQLIEHHGMDANEIVQKIKEEADKMNKDEWN
jgi:hypothetical protein